jgi:hypothetical protein
MVEEVADATTAESTKAGDGELTSGSQQSEAAHVRVAQVTPVNVSFRWFVPSTHAAKLVPLPSTSSHVGLALQQSDAAQVPVAQLPVKSLG